MPRWQTTTASRPENAAAHFDASAKLRRIDPGMRRGSASKSSSVRTSMIAGALAVPTRRGNFFREMLVGDDTMLPPLFGWGAILERGASWGDRKVPIQTIKGNGVPPVKGEEF